MTESPSPADYARAYDTLDFLMGAVEAAAFQRTRQRIDTAELAVVLVTGFLGAGKTTLMRRLVSGDHGLRLAAIVNDVANLNVDAALVADAGAAQGNETLALANGCVCCSLSGGVAKVLADIQTWAAIPDCVLLEASGVADPSALAAVIGSMDDVRLDAVVAVVDAGATTEDQDDAERLIARGVRVADLVLVNKTDLVSPAEASALECELADMAPKAAILRTVDCAVPAGLVFDLPPRAEGSLTTGPALEDDRFATVELVQRQAISRRDFEALIATAPAGLYRAKGTLRLTDTPAPELLQAVGRRWRWRPAGSAATRLAGRLVLVAGADASDVAAHFQPDLVETTDEHQP
jgi:G3E family GTPase